MPIPGAPSVAIDPGIGAKLRSPDVFLVAGAIRLFCESQLQNAEFVFESSSAEVRVRKNYL